MADTQNEIKAALTGLTYTSESDYPLEFICWTSVPDEKVDAELVRKQLGQSVDVPIEERKANVFFDQCCAIESWFGDEERKNAEGFQKLRDIVFGELTNVKMFRLGKTEVTILLVGSESDTQIGFKTVSVET